MPFISGKNQAVCNIPKSYKVADSMMVYFGSREGGTCLDVNLRGLLILIFLLYNWLRFYWRNVSY